MSACRMLTGFDDISSPSDWPASLPEMRNIDNLLRCSICKGYFDVAVLIQECSHNYCSLCIRQSININKTHCPTCSVKVSGNDLKCNRVLNELVKNFVKVRSKLLELTKSGSVLERKKNDDDSDNDFMKTPKGKNILPKRKLSKGKSPRVTPRNKRKRQRIVDQSDSEDPDYEPVNVSIKQEPAHSKKAESDKVQTDKTTGSTSTSSASSFVECPICGDMINSNAINSHLDTCLTRGEKKSSLRSSKSTPDANIERSPEASRVVTATSISSLVSPPTSSPSSSSSPPKKKSLVTGSNAFICNKPKRKAIPGIVCNLLKDKELKQKLKEWNLSTQGDRKTLIKRYQEFVVIYNAQCDSYNPKSASLIAKEIEIRANQKRFKFAGTSTESASHNLNKDSSTEEVDKAREETMEQHGDHFAQLINTIRIRIRIRKAAESTQEKTSNTVSPIMIDNDDSNQEAQEIAEVEFVKKDEELSGIKTEDLQADSPSIDTKPSEDSSVMLMDPDKPCCIARSDDQNVEHSRENRGCVEDVVMEDCEQVEVQISPEEQSRGDDCPESMDPQPQVPEPPSLSSLVSLNEDENNDDDDHDKGDNGLDSSPSLGLVSGSEEDNAKSNSSESDEDLFKPTFERSPIKVRSLRTRKR